MADKDDEGTEDTTGGGTEGDDQVSDDDASKLLGGSGKGSGGGPSGGTADEDDEPEGADQLGDAGKRALDAMKQARREAREARDKAIRERDEALARAKKYEDKDKSELERATGELTSWKTRAEQAEARMARRELAEEMAPDHATAKQIAQVAKRMQGEDAEALRKDAEELFELLVPADGTGKPPAKRGSGGSPTNGSKPRGGGDPDDDDGEMDPLKLAALVQRRR